MKNNVKRLLIVDDDADVRECLRATFEKSVECEVIQASGGHEALRLIIEASFDIVISDFRMPEGDGLELMMGLRKLNHKTKLIIFSGTPSDILRPFVGETPLVAVVLKPSYRDLVACVQEQLRLIA